MWIHQFLVSRSGCPIRSHAWILIAMFRLAMDFTSCESLSQGHRLRLLQRPANWYGFPHSSLWHLKAGQHARSRGLLGNRAFPYLEQSNGQMPTYHSKRLHKAADLLWKSGRPKRLVDSNPSLAEDQIHLKRRKRNIQGIINPTVENGVIVWGSTSPLESIDMDTLPSTSTKRSTPTITTTTTIVTTTTTAASTTVPPKGPGPGSGTGTHKNNPSTRVSTMEPPATPSGNGKDVDVPPPKLPGETSGLAVHQIITITVSLIMVIAALITTLVLKNCCAQSGNTRRNSHQRKINQQEESCQNLTDFTPARVPSNLDIFTAYNETLQCSHECVRTPVPVYTEETILPPGDYKTSFNGNRIPLVNL